jgi:hypothetical protein
MFIDKSIMEYSTLSFWNILASDTKKAKETLRPKY